MKARKRERRDLLIMLVIILLGFLCILLTSGWALRFAPRWELTADMGSIINPDSEFPVGEPGRFFPPVNSGILTNVPLFDNLMTSGAFIPTQPALPTQPPTKVLIPTSTIVPVTNTALPPSATNTYIYYPPPPTRTPRPKPIKTRTPTPIMTGTSASTAMPSNTPTITLTPSSTPVPPPSADLSITKTDAVTSYTPGFQTIYSIVVKNNGPDAVIGAVISDNKPPQITTWGWNCTPNPGCNPMPTSSANFTDTVDLSAGASIIYTVTANIDLNATGNLINTATVSVPSSYIDLVSGNNSATDMDAQYVPLSLACFTSPVDVSASTAIYPVAPSGTCFRYQDTSLAFGDVFTIQELSGMAGTLTWFGKANPSDTTCSTYPQNAVLPGNGTLAIPVRKFTSSNYVYVEVSGTTSVQITVSNWADAGCP